MKLDHKEIFETAMEFVGVFLASVEKRKSFLNVFAGLLYATRAMSKSLEVLNMIEPHELDIMEKEFNKTIQQNIDAHAVILKELKEKIDNE
jgi:hypothetical protein